MSATADQMAWLFGGDTGQSSECVWRHMTGTAEPEDGFKRNAYPLDPADLGRCVRLLDRFPEWWPRVPEMAAHGPEWAGLAEHWGELVALYREEEPTGMARRCYDRMKEILHPIEDSHLRIVRITKDDAQRIREACAPTPKAQSKSRRGQR